jgi:hypothetical protein
MADGKNRAAAALQPAGRWRASQSSAESGQPWLNTMAARRYNLCSSAVVPPVRAFRAAIGRRGGANCQTLRLEDGVRDRVDQTPA